MIIEKILPINFYNELSGVVTDSSIALNLIKQNFPQLFNELESSGCLPYLNNSINKWFLTIFIHKISETYSLFIWDLFLLEGNIIFFKSLYAIISILTPFILKCKSFDGLNLILTDGLLKENNRPKLAYYLIAKKYNFNMEMIKRYRKGISKRIIKEIIDMGFLENKEKKKKDDKDIICDLKNPLCLKNKKDLLKDYDNIVLKQLNKPEVIDDYFINYEKKYEKDKMINNKDEDNFEDLLIERRKHFCILEENTGKDNVDDDELIKIIEGEDKGINIFEKIINENDFDNSFDDINNNQMNRISIDVAKGSERDLIFLKEKEDNKFIFDD